MSVAIRPAHFPWLDYSRYAYSLGLTPGGITFLSGQTASGYDPAVGRVVVKGDLAEQACTAYAKVGAILQAAGLGAGDVVRIVEYLPGVALDDYADAERARDQFLQGHRCAVSTVAVERLLRPEALIEVEVVAGSGEHELLARGIGTPRFVDARAPIRIDVVASLGGPGEMTWVDKPGVALGMVRAGDVLLAFGKVEADPATARALHAGDVVAQTELVYRAILDVLAGAGAGPEHLVKTVEYVAPSGLARYPETGALRRKLLVEPYPAATGVVCRGLEPAGCEIAVGATAILA